MDEVIYGPYDSSVTPGTYTITYEYISKNSPARTQFDIELVVNPAAVPAIMMRNENEGDG